MSGKFRNEDLSIYFFLKSVDIGGGQTLGQVVTLVDGYPYNQIEDGTLVVPSVAIEHRTTSDADVGELGASWYRRTWEVNVFANSDTQRDDLADYIFQALNGVIPKKDFTQGYRKDTGKSLSGADLRVIEHMNVENRTMRPTYAFNLYQKIKYWRVTIVFETVSTQAS